MGCVVTMVGQTVVTNLNEFKAALRTARWQGEGHLAVSFRLVTPDLRLRPLIQHALRVRKEGTGTRPAEQVFFKEKNLISNSPTVPLSLSPTPTM